MSKLADQPLRSVGLLLVSALAAGAVVACASGSSEPRQASPASRSSAADFDAARALRLVKLQLHYGQRPGGSPQLRRLSKRLRVLLPQGRFEPVAGRGLRNVVGTLPGRRPGIVVGAHYDVLASPPGFVGANNGAAGTAVVLELARALARESRPPGGPELRFVLFDGEEPASGLPEQTRDFYSAGLRGSRAYVAAHPGRTAAMILLDYVGNRGLRLPREASSSPCLWSELRRVARARGYGATFPPAPGPLIVDDHTPFLRAGVAAIDLIDWSYPGHDVSDRFPNLARSSLEAVGESVLGLVRRLERGDLESCGAAN